MKKTFFLCLLIISLTAISACSNQSVSRSKAKDAAEEVAQNEETNQSAEATEKTEGESTNTQDGEAKIGLTNNNPNKLTITFPSQKANYTTGSNWNVIRGTASKETAAIEINGYRLQKFIAGSQNWNYIAAVKMQTLNEGENEYVIKAFDAEENVIDEMTYHINYQNGHALPNVGTSLNIILLLTFIFTLNFFIRRKQA